MNCKYKNFVWEVNSYFIYNIVKLFGYILIIHLNLDVDYVSKIKNDLMITIITSLQSISV